ncbi:holo-[acyl-carrier-protein] synthase [Powellomyces hirtus]|uniref:holo-[acyl-carrier-protein] synthase n=1 Tax=Powellomyces hirtus TaxID=109895 RepID=A0A507DXI3_9FUNG|nr:holo-[acyl-carrier-protein] synthase [Powellomyces hirtus]
MSFSAKYLSDDLTCWSFHVPSWSPSDELKIRLVRLLPPAEQEKILRYRFPIDQCRSLLGQLLAHTSVLDLLATRDHSPNPSLASQWSDIEIARDERGKPFLMSPQIPFLQFNVSHHGDWVVVAAGCAKHLGVDVSSVDNPSDDSVDEYLTVFDEVFTQLEWAYIRGAQPTSLNSLTESYPTPPNSNSKLHSEQSASHTVPEGWEISDLQPRIGSDQQKLHRFAQLWALKESYVKAIGVGLALDLRRIEFQFSDFQSLMNDPRPDRLPHSICVAVDSVIRPEFEFSLTYLDPRHPVACCRERNSQQISETLSLPGRDSEAHDDIAEKRSKCAFTRMAWTELYSRIVAATGRIAPGHSN